MPSEHRAYMGKDNGKPKTLAGRLARQIALLIAAVLVMSAAAVWGVVRIHQDMDQAMRGFRQLRSVYEIGLHVSSALQAGDHGHALAAVQAAQSILSSDDQAETVPAPQWLMETWSAGESLANTLQNAAAALAVNGPDATITLQSLPRQLNQLTLQIKQVIVTRQQQVARERRATLWTVLALATVVIIGAIAIGVRQHRAVIRPLNRLGRAVRHVAGGDFGTTIEPFDDVEFAHLGQDFNEMARQLGLLYHDLETQVAQKSKELARSQRLASVGHLAAGVAHEINNPLGIIAGYSERALQVLDRQRIVDEPTVARTQKALQVICDEAFRCKQITDRLLMLARPGAQGRQAISLLAIARDVISSISGLPHYADRRFVLKPVDDAADFCVLANEGEMKQVVVNLVMNGIEATTAGVGELLVTVSRERDQVELRVCDNGRGMTRDTIDHVFEPFFTQKRGERPGTGLGLSITHAIVQDHGGRIIAESDGPGLGSRFIVTLPAATAVVMSAALA